MRTSFAIAATATFALSACSPNTSGDLPVNHVAVDGSWILKWSQPKPSDNAAGITVTLRPPDPSKSLSIGKAPVFYRVDISERQGKIAGCIIASSDENGNIEGKSDPKDEGEQRVCRWEGINLVVEIKSPGKGGFTFDLKPITDHFEGVAKIKIAKLPIASVNVGSVKFTRLKTVNATTSKQ
jgi:hypothetical protein